MDNKDYTQSLSCKCTKEELLAINKMAASIQGELGKKISVSELLRRAMRLMTHGRFTEGNGVGFVIVKVQPETTKVIDNWEETNGVDYIKSVAQEAVSDKFGNM